MHPKVRPESRRASLSVTDKHLNFQVNYFFILRESNIRKRKYRSATTTPPPVYVMLSQSPPPLAS